MLQGIRRLTGRYAWPAGLALGVAAVAVLAAGEAGLVLFDAPRGAWLAEVRPDTPVVVLEERDGWRHVRVEGWIPVRAGSPAGSSAPTGSAPTASVAAQASGTTPPAPSPAPPAAAASPAVASPAATAPSTAASGGSVRGTLLPRPGMTPATVGASLVVLLVNDLATLDAEQASIGGRCRATIQDLDRQLAEIETRVQTALNSTNNFTEASRRYDRAKAERAAARSARAAAVKGCFDESDALYDRHAVARVGSDTTGQYEFRGVADGEYRVVARDRQSETVRVWSLACAVAGGASITIDAATAAGAPDPYWGLR